MAFQHLKGAYRKAGEGLFIKACSFRMRGNGFKLEEGRFRPDIRKKFFIVVGHWNRLPRVCPFLEAFKARLDEALSKLVQREVSLPIPEGWNKVILWVPSNPNHSVILRTH